ncbi:MAG TPA: SpoIIIAH-like family protein [Thermoanaerobacterales bacterium]|nr:SpoIIIAH-like family protein [Thermoanaerobacterales bacterium]
MAVLIKKRILLIIFFICILFVSIYLMFVGNFPNIVYEKAPETDLKQVTSQAESQRSDAVPETNSNKSDFFIDYKLERDRLRSQEADYLRELINNPNTAQQSKDKAQKELLDLSQRVEKEMIIENLIKAKGFEEAVIFLSNDVANVVVKTKGLKEKDVAQITDIITKTVGIPIEKITIIERK